MKKADDSPNSFAAALHEEFGIESRINDDLFLSEPSADYWRETMILGRVQLLTGVCRTEVQPEAAVLKKRKKGDSSGKRSHRVSLIRSLGPGRLFLSG